MTRLVAWLCASRVRQVGLLALVCCVVYLPRLGATGFSMSEGHRVIPAWEMLDDARAGDPHWLVPRMFGTAYLRKPPGMLWAIAASSAIFGENEFAARLPSALAATLLAVVVWAFGTRWFGSPWGLAGGLAQALLPVLWPSARSAEIEALHILTTGAAALIILHMAWSGHRWAWTWAIGLILTGASLGFTKGPAGTPFVVAAYLSFFVLRPRFTTMIVSFLAIGGAYWVLRWSLRPFVEAASGQAVVQGVDDFLWQPGRIGQILTIGPVVLATMLPASLALLFPWGPDAASELVGERATAGETPRPRAGRAPTPATVTAKALAWASISSLLILTVFGVGNPRYGLPVCVFLTPLVAYGARGAGGAFVRTRPAIARAMLLGRPWVWPVVLLIGAGAYVGVLEPHRRASSGRGAGVALAADLPDGAIVWADEMIEARPEVLLYAVRGAEREGKHVKVRWYKPSFMPDAHPDGLLLLLREDALVDEVAQFEKDGRFGKLAELARGTVHKYTFVLCRPEH